MRIENRNILKRGRAFYKTVTIDSYPTEKNGCSSVLITLEAYQKRQVEKALEHLMLGLPDKSIIQIG